MARRDPLPPLSPTRAFEATGRLLSISKAADELSVTPAAVSRQVRALEDFLQASLFERVHGGLVLTSAGARYLSDLMPLFAMLRAATYFASARRPRLRCAGSFRVRRVFTASIEASMCN
jgi:LysR family transcriptional regulator, glycine cleavage system transcriptional activator